MFHFTGYRVLFPISFRKRRRSSNSARLPHSEISGSKVVCTSPKLIAAYHVLHRLLTPRHPLRALRSLIPPFSKTSGNSFRSVLNPRGFSSLLCSLVVTRLIPSREPRRAAIFWIFEYLPRTARSAQFQRRAQRPPLQFNRLADQEKLSFLHVDVKERPKSASLAVPSLANPSARTGNGGPDRT